MGAGRGRTRRAAATATAVECRVTLYRSGKMQKVNEFGPATELYEALDEYAPPGRTPRLRGLFCSATPEEFMTWHNSNPLSGPFYDATPTRVFYQGPEPYAYPVRLYED